MTMNWSIEIAQATGWDIPPITIAPKP